MRLVYWHDAPTRNSGACLTDLTECEWYEYARTNWYASIVVLRIIDVPELQAKMWKAGNVKLILRKDLRSL